MPTVLPTERIAHLSYGRRLLRCGISILAMTAWDQLRSSEDVRGTTALAPKAEVHPRSCYVAQVPEPAVSNRSRAFLLDHLVGEREQFIGHGEAERFDCPEADHELEFDGL